MNPPWVLVDSSWACYRAFYATKKHNLSYDDLPTGVIFGVFEAIRTICFDPRIRSNKVAFFFDSNQSYRKDFFPAYKVKRSEKTDEEIAAIKIMKSQMERLRTEILPDIGFPCFRQTGLESDDLIAQAAKQLDRGVGLQAVIVTADNDLWQCIRQSTVHWFDPGRNLYFDETGLWAHKEIDPEGWLEMKCLMGCDTDGIPGIRGIGEVRAGEYVRMMFIEGDKLAEKCNLPKNLDIKIRNRELIELPHPKTKPVPLPIAPEYNESHFWSQMSLLGIESYLQQDRYAQWTNFFKGNLSPGGKQATLARRIK